MCAVHADMVCTLRNTALAAAIPELALSMFQLSAIQHGPVALALSDWLPDALAKSVQACLCIRPPHPLAADGTWPPTMCAA